MSDNALAALVPFLFIGIWLIVALVTYHFSGWAKLVERFPDRLDQPVRRLRFRSGRMGKGSRWNPWGGVSYSGCLRFDICRTGLRVAAWRIALPFSQPFLVPWDKIAVEQQRFLFFRYYRLTFGSGELSALTIDHRAFRAIAEDGLLKVGRIA